MEKTLYKHSTLLVTALIAALGISTSGAVVFAKDTATLKVPAPAVAVIGRFVVTPNSSTYIPAAPEAPAA